MKLKAAPNEFLLSRLSPIGSELDAMGAAYLMVGFIPSQRAFQIVSNAPDKDKPTALRAVANALLEHAAAIERDKSALILPPRFG